MRNHWVITFESIYCVLKAEKILKEKGFSAALIPPPREISSDCGIALQIIVEKIDLVKNLLSEKGFTNVGYFQR